MKPLTKIRSLIVAASIPLTVSACVLMAEAGPSRQGWTDADREAWYWATQGSRLIPVTWFEALEVPGSQERFAEVSNLARFGFLAPPAGSGFDRPIGFVKDRQADADFKVTGLEWYEGQGHSRLTAETWMGLNCSACHTAQIDYEGTSMTIDGGPGLVDFQLFVEGLDEALNATWDDPEKWSRFEAAVLAGKESDANSAKLKDAFETLLAWQMKTDAMNETPMRYGFGRLDAVGHILNKVLMFNGAEVADGNPANAPVSYPFVWDIWRQDQVQWNGVARNSRFQLPGDPFEYGALGRNAGEVLGVFGDVNIEKKEGLFGDLKGFSSSLQTENLVELELILQGLEAPRWPSEFPAIDQDLAAMGQGLFQQKCSSCHLTPDMQSEDKGTEVMVTFEETLRDSPENLTDIWMACNAWVYEGPSGPMKGMKDVNGDVIGDEAPVANMLAVAVKGSLIGDKPGLVKSGVRNFFGIRKQPDIIETLPADPRQADRQKCLTATNEPLLAYKARPLDGIWATAPYLHNGSVASLYELLLPASERMESFWVGSREYDPVKVGYQTSQPTSGLGFELNTREGGKIIEGNSNIGHEYGAETFDEEDRMALIEYMKTL